MEPRYLNSHHAGRGLDEGEPSPPTTCLGQLGTRQAAASEGDRFDPGCEGPLDGLEEPS